MAAKLTLTREIAYDSFLKVIDENKEPNEVLDDFFQRCDPPLKRIDRNFAKEVLFGGLRWYSKIYWILQKTSKRKLDDAQPSVRAALVLGAYQIFYMNRVPDRAAVNESVEYVRKKGNSEAVKFVNGVLRSIAARAEYFAKPDKDKQPCDYYALQYSHPRWIVERWLNQFGPNRIRDILSANNQQPPYTIRVNSMKVKAEGLPDFRDELLREDKNHSERCSLRSALKLQNAPNFDEGSLFARGFYSVQDEASQLIPLLLNVQSGECIVDACCGKGVKLSQIYELAQGSAQLIAIEKNQKQLEKAKETFNRLGHAEPTWVNDDFLNFKPTGPIQKILLDAPCSGLGIIRRHPESKWQKAPAIVAKMVKAQRDLLVHALDILPSGGEIIFSVCSFEPEETLDHLAWIQKEYRDKIEVVSPVERLPDYYKRFVTRENVLLIFSGNKEDMDGFGAFIIRKT